MLKKEEVNSEQIKIMESLGFEYKAGESSVYAVIWEFSIYPFETIDERYSYRYSVSPRMGQESDLLHVHYILSKLATFYVEMGRNKVIQPIRKALNL